MRDKSVYEQLSLRECRQWLQDPQISDTERVLLLCREGMLLAKLGRHQEALTSCDRAMGLQPDSEEVWHSRGIILMRAQRYKEVLEHFNRALEIRSDYGRVWYNRGIVLLQLGQEQEAATSFEQALSLCQNFHKVWYTSIWTYHGLALLRMGHFAQAIASWDCKLVCVKGGEMRSNELAHLRQEQSTDGNPS
jgi:tetratricopeptide (TPR) repeat protein